MFVYAYPVRFERAQEGGWVITSRDLPEVVSQAEDSEDRVDVAEGALQAAIEGRILSNEAIPSPSDPKKGEEVVAIPVDTAAKAALYSRVRELGLSKADLAKKMEVNEKEARRLLDPTHPSKLPRIAQALHALGQRLQLAVA